ncbi:molybdopterin molybdotransferase MoeA [Lentisphaera marina]|uniref:molybdopterin molybdotransferase MoeA n=1 Tax=Lentisphaera marina TaxID=1111041 RepID=UPI0023659ADD|nr:molybdopterin molybdotransferase MoeA [Lentisphaera marina]MDD7986979.1 molybdopterin molybdotransferase MoeA [Lentisphaera marina]
MISVQEAEKLICQHSPHHSSELVETLNAHNRVLAEDIIAERENPPFNRVAMDGIAINYAQWQNSRTSFQIKGTQAAGHPPLTLEDSTTCLEVMTGAVLPHNCDCVIPVERIKVENQTATLENGLDLKQWQNVHLQGSDHDKGFVLAHSGQVLNAPEIAVAAAAGYGKVKVAKLAKIAVIATGDELVSSGVDIKAWQIRRSNTTAITASLKALNYDATEYHIKDNLETLRAKLSELLNTNDMLILTGGVSMGKFDFVPQILKELKVEQIFHKVTQRPGKPLWFGTCPEKSVFGLPGNPVSALINFQRYILPQLLISQGLSQKPLLHVELSEDFSFNKNMTRFLPVSIHSLGSKLLASPQRTNGSGDFGALSGSDGFIELEAEVSEFKANYIAPFYSW